MRYALYSMKSVVSLTEAPQGQPICTEVLSLLTAPRHCGAKPTLSPCGCRSEEFLHAFQVLVDIAALGADLLIPGQDGRGRAEANAVFDDVAGGLQALQPPFKFLFSEDR